MNTKTRLRLFLVTVLAFALIGTVRPAAALVISPLDSLMGYYSAINLKNYQVAYSFWLNPIQAYNDFANGFGTTRYVEPYFGLYEPANATTGAVRAVLLGYHTDGVVESYNGCFNVQYNGATGNWQISSSTFALISNAGIPVYASIQQYLAISCLNPVGSVTPQFRAMTLDKGQTAMNSYYDLINRRLYSDAYAMWLYPIAGPKPNGAPADDYRPDSTTFASGYSTTTFVTTYWGTYNEEGGSAGHGYLDGFLPAVLVGLHSDGSVVAYYGCYVLGYQPGSTSLGIVSGVFKPLTTTGTPLGAAILQGMQNDCISLQPQL